MERKIKISASISTFLFMLLVLFPGCKSTPSMYEPKEGDIVFQSLRKSELVEAIEGMSRSEFSHCGMIFKLGKSWSVIEALGNVHYTPLNEWVKRGRYEKYAVFRLKNYYVEKTGELKKAIEQYIGKLYDYRYELDDSKIYCSELIYKALKSVYREEIGTLQRLGDLNWRPFEKTIKKYEKGEIPLDRLIITPASLSRASQLLKIKDY